MFDFAELHAAPPNISDYVNEILPGFRDLYGPEAADFYAIAGADGIAASIARPEVLAFGCRSGTDVSAILLAKQEKSRTTLSFLHVLEPYRGLGAERALIEFALDALDNRAEIVTEFISFYPADWDSVFVRRGFGRLVRQLMCGPTRSTTPTIPASFEFVHPAGGDLEALASVLTDSYRGHPERFLFPEVQSESQALDYLARVSAGHFGRHAPSHTVAVWIEGQCVGFGVGCQVLPGLGFVLHLAVRPAWRRKGIGRMLLQGLRSAFAREGLDYIALGVTCDNPAVNLYQRVGFQAKKRIPVYYRAATTLKDASPSGHP